MVMKKSGNQFGSGGTSFNFPLWIEVHTLSTDTSHLVCYRWGRSVGAFGSAAFGLGAIVAGLSRRAPLEQADKSQHILTRSISVTIAFGLSALASFVWAVRNQIKLIQPDYTNPQEVEAYAQLCRYGVKFPTLLAHIGKVTNISTAHRYVRSDRSARRSLKAFLDKHKPLDVFETADCFAVELSQHLSRNGFQDVLQEIGGRQVKTLCEQLGTPVQSAFQASLFQVNAT
eukprot:954969-Prorocentrum_minimum.AAC.3